MRKRVRANGRKRRDKDGESGSMKEWDNEDEKDGRRGKVDVSDEHRIICGPEEAKNVY